MEEFALRPHVGRTISGREVHFAQDMIYVRGLHVGFVGHERGAAVNLIRALPEDTKQRLVAFITHQRGAAPHRVAEAPPLEGMEEEL